MFKLDRKLGPDEFIQTFFEANRQDHQRPPHPWEAMFREGKCTREQLQGWGKERYYFTKQVPIKEYSILYNCPHVDVRRMWLPKAIEEEGEDLIGGTRQAASGILARGLRRHGPGPRIREEFRAALRRQVRRR